MSLSWLLHNVWTYAICLTALIHVLGGQMHAWVTLNRYFNAMALVLVHAR